MDDGAHLGRVGEATAALARLRAVVAYLGEDDHFGWWPTSFLSATGQRVLAFNFPRTALSAGVNAATHSARRLHDERIGTAGAYHLFRLPFELESRIHNYLLATAAEAFASLVESREVAMDALRTLSGDETKAGVGPVRVSSAARMMHRPSLRRTAACYAHAFVGDAQAFPYFTSD
jgi:hypothetical protein